MYPKVNPLSGLIYSARSSDVELVIVNGEIVLENGQYCTLDLEKVMYMAERTSKELLGL